MKLRAAPFKAISELKANEMKEEETREREIRALVKCAKELHPANATILTKNEKRVETIEGVKIRFVPLLDWLLGQEPKTYERRFSWRISVEAVFTGSRGTVRETLSRLWKERG